MNEKSKTIIVLDTNFLMIPGQYKVDIFEQIDRLIKTPYEITIFEETIEELVKIANSKKKDNSNAKVALKLIKQKNLKILKNSLHNNSKYIDEIILNNIKENFIVCTRDKELKRLLKNKFKKIKIITLKAKKNIDFE